MLQFGLKTLLLLTLLAAAACAAFFVLPTEWGVSIFMIGTLGLAAPLTAGVVYCEGYGRAFAVGGLSAYGAWVLTGIPVAFVMATALSGSPYDSAQNLAALLVDDSESGNCLRYFSLCWPLLGFAGLLGMAVRWRSLRRTPNE